MSSGIKKEDVEVPNEQERPDSFSWTLLRLTLVEQQIFRFKHFLTLAGFDANGLIFVSELQSF